MDPARETHRYHNRQPLRTSGLRGLDPVFIRKAIATGNAWCIHWRYPGFLPETAGDIPPIVIEITDFLDMWSCIEAGFEALDAPDQKAFQADNELMPPVFQGFDGGSEAEYQRVARFMIEHLACFGKFSGRDLDSYHPVVDDYRRILKVFQPIWARISGTRTLTADELRAVLSCCRQAAPGAMG